MSNTKLIKLIAKFLIKLIIGTTIIQTIIIKTIMISMILTRNITNQILNQENMMNTFKNKKSLLFSINWQKLIWALQSNRLSIITKLEMISHLSKIFFHRDKKVIIKRWITNTFNSREIKLELKLHNFWTINSVIN
jgi:hypothetical protein